LKETQADHHQPHATKDEHVLLALFFLFLLRSNCFPAGFASAGPDLGEGPVRQKQQQQRNPECSLNNYQHTSPRLLV
jgi:hypothetical protein